MKTCNVILSILIATSAGALVGVFFAPQQGEDTRKKISEMEKEYADAIKEKFDETLDRIAEKFNKVKDDVAEFAYQANDKAEKIKKGK
jgi:gas vesicle protein